MLDSKVVGKKKLMAKLTEQITMYEDLRVKYEADNKQWLVTLYEGKVGALKDILFAVKYM